MLLRCASSPSDRVASSARPAAPSAGTMALAMNTMPLSQCGVSRPTIAMTATAPR
jgi:hypothetical protein